MAAQASPRSWVDSLREALTRPSKIQQRSWVSESHHPSARVASHHKEPDKTYSETGDDPADESQDDGHWETDSLGIHETSEAPTEATRKWDDLNLPAMCE
ncbi:hypothetical protein BDW75DRAFT_238253 [Aspergillus navahoensis]